MWRLANERAWGIVDYVNTVGLRPWTYLLGMLFFDVTLSIATGMAMVGFAVGCKLGRFDGAPVDLLFYTVFCSSIALNGLATLSTKVVTALSGGSGTAAQGSSSSLLSNIAAVLTVTMPVVSAFLTTLLYYEDGSWPDELSLVPWLAQGRCLYVILVYHRTNSEVDAALGIMFAFGIGCVGLTIVLDEKDALVAYLSELSLSETTNHSISDSEGQRQRQGEGQRQGEREGEGVDKYEYKYELGRKVGNTFNTNSNSNSNLLKLRAQDLFEEKMRAKRYVEDHKRKGRALVVSTSNLPMRVALPPAHNVNPNTHNPNNPSTFSQSQSQSQSQEQEQQPEQARFEWVSRSPPAGASADEAIVVGEAWHNYHIYY